MRPGSVASVVLVAALAAACQDRKPVASPQAAQASPTPGSRAPGPPEAPGPAPVASASAVPASPEAKGTMLSVAVYMKGADGKPAPVDATRAFRSGESIRFGITASQAGHLYFLLKGSSGRAALIFPDKRIDKGNNAVAAGAEVVVPKDGWFRFDNKPGTEMIYALHMAQVDSGLATGVETATGFNGAPPNPSLESDVLSQLQSRSARDMPIVGASPAPAAPPAGITPASAAPAAPGPPVRPIVASGSGTVVAVIQLKHE